MKLELHPDSRETYKNIISEAKISLTDLFQYIESMRESYDRIAKDEENKSKMTNDEKERGKLFTESRYYMGMKHSLGTLRDDIKYYFNEALNSKK